MYRIVKHPHTKRWSTDSFDHALAVRIANRKSCIRNGTIESGDGYVTMTTGSSRVTYGRANSRHTWVILRDLTEPGFSAILLRGSLINR